MTRNLLFIVDRGVLWLLSPFCVVHREITRCPGHNGVWAKNVGAGVRLPGPHLSGGESDDATAELGGGGDDPVLHHLGVLAQ